MFTLGIISYSSARVIEGFYAGGVNGFSGVTVSTIDKFVFTSETCAALGTSLSTATAAAAATSSSTKGYIWGGNTSNGTSGNTSVVQALTFVGATVASLGATIPTQTAYVASGQSSTKGYCFAGANGGSAITTVQILTFGTEATSTGANALLVAVWSSSGVYSSTKSYICGGNATIGFAQTGLNTIQALTFSGETTATLLSTLPSALIFGANTSCSSSKGYIQGGYSATVTKNSIQALTFSGETTATLSATLGTGRGFASSINSSSKTYTGGGSGVYSPNVAGDIKTIIDSLDFAGETDTVLSAVLSVARAPNGGLQG